METTIPKQEFFIRNLGTKSVTLYPTKAQIVRNINGVSLKPGLNQITISGLTPTCDEHSIKVDGTGAATITDLTVELVPNPEVYADIYPDEDESEWNDSEISDSETETATGRLREIANRTAQLNRESERLCESINSANSRLAMIESYLSHQANPKTQINLREVTDGYRDERSKIFEEKTAAATRNDAIRQELVKLTKEERRLTRESRKAKRKADKEKAKAREKEERRIREKREEKARIHRERAKFWPKKVFKITISIEAPSGFTPASSRRSSIDSTVKVPEVTKSDVSLDSAEVNLSLSYITYSASWTPRYDLSLNTVNNTGVLDYSAELTNETSETWRDAKVILSTSQSTYQGLSDTIPTLQPWHIRLMRGDAAAGPSAALQPSYEINKGHQSRKELPPQLYQPRHKLFGVSNSSADYRLNQQFTANSYGVYVPPAGNSYGAPVPPAPPLMQQQQMEPIKGSSKELSARGGNMLSYSMSRSAAPQAPLTSNPYLKESKKASRSLSGMMARKRGNSESMEEHEDGEEEADGYYGADIDGATLGGITEPALLFEESSFEESGLTTTYDLPTLKTLAPVSTATKHKIARVEFKAIAFSHIVVPKLRTDAFLKAKLRNISKITLLKGTAGLTVDGSFLGQSTIPRCTAGDSFTLNLGVDPSVTVGYSRPTVQRSSSGLFTKENCEVFTRVATLTNTKGNVPVDLTLLEQVPISEDERLKVDILTPRGMRLGGESVLAGAPKDGDKPRESIGATSGQSAAGVVRAGVYGKDSKWGSAIATAKKGGEISFNVKINPGRGCKLVLEYETTYPGGEKVISA